MTLMQKNKISKSVRAFVLTAIAVSALSACAAPATEAPESYNETYPIKISREQVSITIALPESGVSLIAEDARRFKGFLRDYVQRGRSQVIIETALPAVAQSVLVANGFRAGELNFIDSANISAPNAILSFTANTAQVPDCGDWSESTAFNPENAPLKNFGCANRRNIGLIVSDPGDMIQSQPMSGGSAARRDAKMDLFNAGEDVAAPPTVDAQAVSGATTSQ
ncbi:MAG: hypothetical protein KAI73_04420 [Rhodospirillaceae bacterium]|nr:hypothetical protein [Rhodospirillaceae bacterium]